MLKNILRLFFSSIISKFSEKTAYFLHIKTEICCVNSLGHSAMTFLADTSCRWPKIASTPNTPYRGSSYNSLLSNYLRCQNVKSHSEVFLKMTNATQRTSHSASIRIERPSDYVI
jgi:hypothetical protein